MSKAPLHGFSVRRSNYYFITLIAARGKQLNGDEANLCLK